MRVGINLCWLVPGDVGGSEQAVTRALAAVADHGPSDVEPVLFVLDEFTNSHPELVQRFETHVMPASAPLSKPGRHAVVRAATKPLRVLGELVWLPRAIAKAGVDVVYDAGGTSPGRLDVPRVLGIHDIQPLDLPRNFHPVKVAWLRRTIPIAVRKSSVITVPSEFVRGRVVDTFADVSAGDDRVRVVPWNVPSRDVARDPARDAAVIDRFRAVHDATGPLILQAGITYPHKDHVTTIAAFTRIAGRHRDARLVLAGGAGPAEGSVLSAIDNSGVVDRIIRTGRLGDEEIGALVAHAHVVVVPSRYEGFGIPALEAMAARTPVVVADAGSLPEVIGAAGAVFPPGDDAQLAIELHHCLTDSDTRTDRIAAGVARAATFSAPRTASALVEAWRAAYRSELAGL